MVQFSAFIDQNGLHLTHEGLMEYITQLHQQYTPRTIKRKIASVKAFCNHLEYERLVNEIGTDSPTDTAKVNVAGLAYRCLLYSMETSYNCARGLSNADSLNRQSLGTSGVALI
mgnify:CR=1 FL=1